MFTRVDSLDGVVTEAAAAGPDRVALSDTVRTLTYGQLRARSATVAVRLAEQGVRKGDLVGLAVDRSVDTVVGMLAILRCGAAYVPIDPTYPLGRQKLMVQDSGIEHAVGSAGALAGAGGLNTVRTHELDGEEDETAEEIIAPASPAPSDPAYVIYTSGSTGRPKGCVVTHGNVLSLLHHTLPLFTVDADDRWSVFHSFSFDFSVWELWGALATGARAVIVPQKATRLPAELVRTLVEEKVTVLSQVPSVFRTFTSLERYPADRLRYVVFGGESVDLPSVGRFWSRCEGTRPKVINMYGITETTVHATFRPLTEQDVATGTGSPIGRPLPHLTVELRAEEHPHLPVPDGETGEIWLSGPGVTTGYLNRPDLTAQRFVSDAASGIRRRYYRSGDLARRLPNGELDYLGRNDHQIKLRGFRIELPEIEAALRTQPQVRDAAVCVVTGRRDTQWLVACVVLPTTETEKDRTALLARALTNHLPKHMLPDRYLLLPALPLTPSGKLDRQTLTRSASEAVTRGHTTPAPR
ncbi:amino acid adenylation domain-containing protein [Streptomyces sp. B21-083]|uniref:amino acid adenylation domain-containing protein n=1 Tax=Streptomyces sp. B21-083 TaxID=3039410 RepID=UPI002FF352CF